MVLITAFIIGKVTLGGTQITNMKTCPKIGCDNQVIKMVILASLIGAILIVFFSVETVEAQKKTQREIRKEKVVQAVKRGEKLSSSLDFLLLIESMNAKIKKGQIKKGKLKDIIKEL